MVLNTALDRVAVVKRLRPVIVPSFGVVTVTLPVAGANEVPPARSIVPSELPFAAFTPRVITTRWRLVVAMSARTAIRSSAPSTTRLIVNAGVPLLVTLEDTPPSDSVASSSGVAKPAMKPVSVFVPMTGLVTHSAAAAAATSASA